MFTVVSCFRTFASTFALPFIRSLADRWPCKPFQQCPLMWWMFVPNFIKISPLSTEISRHAKHVLMDRRTDGQTIQKHNALRHTIVCAFCGSIKHYKDVGWSWFTACMELAVVQTVVNKDVIFSQLVSQINQSIIQSISVIQAGLHWAELTWQYDRQLNTRKKSWQKLELKFKCDLG